MSSRTEVNFIRGFVNHYSFVTGLIGRLDGKEGTPEDSSIGVNVILNAHIIEGFKVTRDKNLIYHFEEAPYNNILQGGLFQCCDLSTLIKDLDEFVIETWNSTEDNLFEWKLTKKTKWSGVEWLNKSCTSDGGTRACATIATFVCKNKTVEEIQDGEVVKLKKTEYPRQDLRKVLKKSLPDPKHVDSYMG